MRTVLSLLALLLAISWGMHVEGKNRTGIFKKLKARMKEWMKEEHKDIYNAINQLTARSEFIEARIREIEGLDSNSSRNMTFNEAEFYCSPLPGWKQLRKWNGSSDGAIWTAGLWNATIGSLTIGGRKVTRNKWCFARGEDKTGRCIVAQVQPSNRKRKYCLRQVSCTDQASCLPSSQTRRGRRHSTEL